MSQVWHSAIFTRREYQIAEQIGLAGENSKIAKNLGISEKTVEQYMVSIRTKLGAKTKWEASAKFNSMKEAIGVKDLRFRAQRNHALCRRRRY